MQAKLPSTGAHGTTENLIFWLLILGATLVLHKFGEVSYMPLTTIFILIGVYRTATAKDGFPAFAKPSADDDLIKVLNDNLGRTLQLKKCIERSYRREIIACKFSLVFAAIVYLMADIVPYYALIFFSVMVYFCWSSHKMIRMVEAIIAKHIQAGATHK